MTSTTDASNINTIESAQLLAAPSLQLAAAAVLGLLVLIGVGLAPMDVAHNAAHVTRHSFAFPCH